VVSVRAFTRSVDDGRQTREGEEDPSQAAWISRGMRILFWQLVVCLAISLVGSLVFLTGRFSGFPYAWF